MNPTSLRAAWLRRQRGHALNGDFRIGDAAALKPSETFNDRQILTIGGKTIELESPERGHTDGDPMVVFRDERVLHKGDLLIKDHYPNIDLEAGGNFQPAAH